MGCLVSVHAERCTCHWNHVLRYARTGLFWSLVAMDRDWQDPILPQIQDPRCKLSVCARLYVLTLLRPKYQPSPNNGPAQNLSFFRTSLSSCHKFGSSTQWPSTLAWRPECLSLRFSQWQHKSPCSSSWRIPGITGSIALFTGVHFTRTSTRFIINTPLHSVLLLSTPLRSKSCCLEWARLDAQFSGSQLLATCTF